MAFDFKKKAKQFQRKKKDLPLILGNMAKNHFLKSFKDGGFTDASFNAWEKRKTRNSSDRRTRERRALLVDTGAMRRSIRVRQASWSRIVVASTMSYAKYHNDPEEASVHRKFIGESKVLRQKHLARIRREIKPIF